MKINKPVQNNSFTLLKKLITDILCTPDWGWENIEWMEIESNEFLEIWDNINLKQVKQIQELLKHWYVLIISEGCTITIPNNVTDIHIEGREGENDESVLVGRIKDES